MSPPTHQPACRCSVYEQVPVVSWQHAFTLQHPVPDSAICRVIPHVARAPSRQCAAGTPCIPGDVLAAVVHEGLVPGPGAAVMEVPPDDGSLPFLCILPRWALFFLALIPKFMVCSLTHRSRACLPSLPRCLDAWSAIQVA